MKRKDLQHIKLNATTKTEAGTEDKNQSTYKTAEGIEVKKEYSKEDIESLKHLGFAAGFTPTFVVHIVQCMYADHGQLGNMQVFLLLKKVMHFTGVTLQQDKKDYL